MPRSPLARLQQITTLSLLAAATAWLAWHWPRSPLLAVVGFAAIVLSYTVFLAVEFAALYVISRTDTSPLPGAWEIARAWVTEAVAAPRVFCWRQPFRWRAVPDCVDELPALPRRRGAVFIHGFMCNRGFWTPWFKPLRERDHAFLAVNLEPWFGSIDDYVAIIDDAVVRMTRATGLPPVLVCHSMGGLAARAWLRAKRADARVAHVITISTPHRGTWLARFSALPNGRQMCRHSEWLGSLAGEANGDQHARFTCWYSNCDNVAVPTSTATLPGADNRLVRGVGHVALAFHPRVMADALERIAKAPDEPALTTRHK